MVLIRRLPCCSRVGWEDSRLARLLALAAGFVLMVLLMKAGRFATH
jgi:hypothetical protein